MAYITKKTTVNGVKPIGSNLYGTCSTASDTAQKTVAMADFDVLVSGVTIHVQFTHKNTASNPTLKVGSTSAAAIKRNGATEGKWKDGSVISFTYDGTNWIQNDADDDGVTYTISASGDTVTLTGSDGSTSSATVADNDTTYGISISGNTLSLVEGGSGTQVTLPNDNTTYTIAVSGHTLTLTPSSGTAQSVTLPDDDTTYTLSKNGSTITLTGSDGSTSSVVDSDTTLQYTADAPDGTTTNNVVQNDVTGNTADGGYALAEGYQTTASGQYSHAEGVETEANGDRSHAEGNVCIADGISSHTEGNRCIASGNQSHAEGNQTVASGSGSHAEGSHSEASGDTSHAEGYYTVASGNRSFAGNHYTIAQRADQTVIGRMNIADTQGNSASEFGKYAFIIGNGNAVDNRSNCFTVDWRGRVECGDYSGVFKSIFDIFYPVGSYYVTTDASFNPNTVWGGTWVRETGETYTASWTATSTNANGARVTNSLTLDAGTYLITIKTPVLSHDNCYFGLNSFSLVTSSKYSSQDVRNQVLVLTQRTTFYVATDMSLATNYSYIERGYLKARRMIPEGAYSWHRTA